MDPKITKEVNVVHGTKDLAIEVVMQHEHSKAMATPITPNKTLVELLGEDEKVIKILVPRQCSD